MTEVDREAVRRVARLARLELSEEETERLGEEMGRVLSRFAELETFEEGGEADPDEGRVGTGMRPDRPDPDPLSHGPGDMAPEWEDGSFLVPRLAALGEEEEER